jgi:hypothetical protein
MKIEPREVCLGEVWLYLRILLPPPILHLDSLLENREMLRVCHILTS